LSVVPFVRLGEGLGHAVALRASDRGEEQLDAQYGGHLCGLPGDLGADTVAEPLQPIWHFEGLEAALDGSDYQITDPLPGDAGIGNSRPGDDVPITGVDDEDDAPHLAIAGTDLKMTPAPADVGAQGNDNAIMGSSRPQSRMFL
jgi:hypothetical protein